MKDKIFNEIDNLKEDLIKDLKTLIQIPSKRGSESKEYPFGIECAKVLETVLQLGIKKDFIAKNVDNYMGFLSIGDGDEYICAIGHLDVVEELSGWKYPPFAGEIHDNKIYGRGALDNKGPILAAFYGLLALKNLGVEFRNEFRIIFGTNEETGMEDLKYYLKKEKAPLMGFSPDNKFPAIYGERGRAKIEISGEENDMFNFINDKFFKGDPIINLNIDISDKDFGRMILRTTTLTKDNNILKLNFSLSTPICNIDEVVNRIEKEADSLKVELLYYYKRKLMEKDAPIVNILNNTYNEVMNENLEPNTTTGMTYAHFCPNIIPFGPSFPGQNGIAHLPNEWMDIDELILCTKIYAYAFYNINESFK